MSETELEKAIAAAFAADGGSKEANKAYLEFIKANFIIPIEKKPEGEEPEVLYLLAGENVFLPVFTNLDYFGQWAAEIHDEIQLLKLTGVDLLKGIGEKVTVSLNIGTPHYKEFNPSELARMRSMVLKIFS
ncbi:SseB family protein [Legionella septentrionalis]|uniref:SseB family protein n=1 Tax=Legionella septentrionalis TaxID=2498109 RepID=UPI000F8C5FC4|nr:SseB family protein [Legionella septentrionalis]RUR10747.1 SseB family protein [Legionella septentrionalis]